MPEDDIPPGAPGRRRWFAAIQPRTPWMPPPHVFQRARHLDAGGTPLPLLATKMQLTPGKITDAAPSADVSLLLQTIVTRGERVSDGTIIEAVSLPWFYILEEIKKNPKVVFEIPPEKWEEIVAGAYKAAKYDEVILTPRSGDRGRDVIAVRKGLFSVRIIDQVKRFNPSLLVDANDVRALLGVLQADQNASKAYLSTTSDFAPGIASDPFIKPFMPYRLELLNGENLLAKLHAIADGKDAEN